MRLESMEVKGRDLIKALPKTVSVTAEELVGMFCASLRD